MPHIFKSNISPFAHLISSSSQLFWRLRLEGEGGGFDEFEERMREKERGFDQKFRLWFFKS